MPKVGIGRVARFAHPAGKEMTGPLNDSCGEMVTGWSWPGRDIVVVNLLAEYLPVLINVIGSPP